ncbi:glucosamine-6-phosphate deaminase [Kineosporiaceae bacterium SCSIO 59966]|nr:glucosamine-6-phosphate deaminase [Kineosporiaceae bacterium SCSIO 59966]
MHVVIRPTATDLARLVADEVEALVRDHPATVLGLATGSSPLAVYAELRRRHQERGLSFASTRGFLLDEYVGLPRVHPQSYRSVMERELVAGLDFADGAVRGPDGTAADLDAECARYEHSIVEAGGVDLQILGIGSNGHVAFNEPGSSLASRTRVERLTPQTRRDNARFFDDDPDAVPATCLTQGLATILDARRIVLIATGKKKARAVAQMVEGPVSARWPATVLQWHTDVTVFLDPAAAQHLEVRERYDEVGRSVGARPR